MFRLAILTLIIAALASFAFAQQFLLNENFEASTMMPANWINEGMYISPGYGVNGSNAPFAYTYQWYPTMWLTTPQVGPIVAGTRFEFAYRVAFDYNTEGIPMGDNSITIKVGEQVLHTINGSNHTPTTGFTTASVSLDSFVGQNIRVQFEVAWGGSPQMVSFHIDDVKIYYILNEHDLVAQSISGSTTLTQNTPTTTTVRVANMGTTTATDYTVKLFLQSTEVATVTSEPIPASEFIDIPIVWTPTEAGHFQLYGYVDFPPDEDLANNQTQAMPVEVLPNNVEIVYIGDSQATTSLINPVFAYTNHSSINQTVYLASEVSTNGIITAVTYRFTGAGDIDPNTPVRLYMTTSDIDGYPGADYWVPAADFTLVYEGTLPVGEAGTRDIRLQLDTPFNYDRDNLIIMAHKLMDVNLATYSTSNRWQATFRDDHYRTLAREQNDTPIDIANMPAGYPVLFIPNIRLELTTGGFGSLSGVVTYNGTPISEALVRINDTNRFTLSNSLGAYSFENVVIGEITLTATRHGFYEYLSENLTISEGQNTTHSFEMTHLPTVSISGDVIAYDTGSPLADCAVLLTGYDNYTTTTNEAGEFTIEGVYANMTYTFTITKNGYLRHTDPAIMVGTSPLTIPTISLMEQTHKPLNVMATPYENHVALSWQAPPVGSEVVFTHSTSEEMLNALGADAAVEFEVAHRYTPAQLQDFGVAGGFLTHVAIMPNYDALYMIKIYLGGSNSPLQPGNLVYEQIITEPLTLGEWNNIELYEMLTIPATDELWIGYLVSTTGGFPAAYDHGPARQGYGNLMKYNETWSTMSGFAGPDYDFNWLIKGYAITNPFPIGLEQNPLSLEGKGALPEYTLKGGMGDFNYSVGGDNQSTHSCGTPHSHESSTHAPFAGVARRAPFPSRERGFGHLPLFHSPDLSTIHRTSTTNHHRSVTSYKIYRAGIDDLHNETQWALIDNNVTATTYIDSSWQTVADGGYRYAVKAVYTGDRLSEPAFSPIIGKNVFSQVIIHINSIDNLPLSSGITRLINHDGNPTHVYQVECACGTVSFPEVWYGQYTLIISKIGFVTYIATLDINESLFTYAVDLETTNILLAESFEGASFPPMGWSLLDADGDGYNFRRRSTDENVSSHSGVWSVVSESWVGNNTQEGLALQPDNYLITPAIPLYEGVEVFLNYFVAIQDDQYPTETYSIMVSTATPAVQDFQEVFTETLAEENTEYQQRELDLTEYAGQTIYIGFRHHNSTDNYQIKFDSITLHYEGQPGSDSDDVGKPLANRLSGNYPNPFNPITTINFHMATKGNVIIAIYNLKGQLVKTLVSGLREAGEHKVVWNGDDMSGRGVASGVYFYRMTTGGYSSVRKMLLLK